MKGRFAQSNSSNDHPLAFAELLESSLEKESLPPRLVWLEGAKQATMLL